MMVLLMPLQLLCATLLHTASWLDAFLVVPMLGLVNSEVANEYPEASKARMYQHLQQGNYNGSCIGTIWM